MFRGRRNLRVFARPSPHARGDVPPRFAPRAATSAFSPRPWGCSAPPAADRIPRRLLPTPVGMFRGPRPALARAHPSPHARGDVPAQKGRADEAKAFSPRPWGCSVRAVQSASGKKLLPTPVGMFRRKKVLDEVLSPSPHARGDVPTRGCAVGVRVVFSPRPWGCSERLGVEDAVVGLLPTPVGMFRIDSPDGSDPRTSPHARGDVPSYYACDLMIRHFSPRPWGCSVHVLTDLIGLTLLPTPVGMFRRDSTQRCRPRASPHARGDVPPKRGHAMRAIIFSPRPWGCSVV